MDTRWDRAQEVEQSHQHHISLDSETEAKNKLNNFPIEIQELEDKKILAVGGGTGMIHAIDSEESVSIDPITNSSIQDIEQSSAELITGVGESLPFPDTYFDAVICYNVLDHTINPEKVAEEIFRILDDDGILIFRLNVYELPDIILSHLNMIDKPHPHHFDTEDVLGLLESVGFDTNVTRIDDKSIFDYSYKELSLKKSIACLVLQWRKIYVLGTK
ncbi:class I SAM-dependent methyltransferase [Haloarcula japonica]|uniref:Type 11 methyltransferase n=1 Tax=Haloarcula japonica (strain ATCC 49778 / DSM 6131 / JCM 7785 / NBRC 101032 / NCIMB 13157 / TR-1) TaxID=1227453 RepID=M0LGJ3_HALJT|nr:class I SAM-dependent methyltransferase [Haloarcula japonica]EMA32747.1 type 11 methyltransferase [Haloarcula japonica DSM 6131]